MDYKDFHNGLFSLVLLMLTFSLTFMIGSIVLKPFISLEPHERDFIIVLCSINLLFSFYYLIEALRLEKVFILEEKYIKKFAKRIGIISLIFLPQIFLFISLLAKKLHNLQIMMTSLIIFIQVLLIGVIFKEVYDLLYLEEAERRLELEKNRKLYLDKER